LDFDEKAVQQVVGDIADVRKELPVQMQKCLAFFYGVDRGVGGYEGLLAANECVRGNERKDQFAAEYTVLGRIREALSPGLRRVGISPFCINVTARCLHWNR
jgi:type I restriction enzyme R subunit